VRVRFSPENLSPGTRIGVYVIVAKLGMGSGGVVYEARTPHGHRVALKISRYRPGVPGSPDSVMDGRFWRSHMCQEQLHGHPNVLQLYAYDRHPDPFHGWQYEVLELMPGAETITDWARRATPSLGDLVIVFEQIAVAMGDMHWLGIRHRDIKPANILVSPDGVPKILDFNSATYVHAKLLTRPAASALPCTEAYLPPEVCQEMLRERWTGQSRRFAYQPTGDLHGLGVILYEVLTGQHPFNLDLEGQDLLVDIAHRTPRRPSTLNPDIPRDLDEIVMMLLRKLPDERYQSAYTVAAELGLLLDELPDRHWSTSFEIPGGQWTNGHLVEAPPVAPVDVAEGAEVAEAAEATASPPVAAPAPEPPHARRPLPRWARLASWLALAAVLLAAGVAAWLLLAAP
jgi:serine/threonine-protein kinase